jgi:Raf kinase inhibitor-like YbhB/YbcL family protein
MPLVLVSPAIPPGGMIPQEYTADGWDISPPLAWSGVPAGTQSLVIVVEDPDAPQGTFHHWAAYDIPPGTAGLPEGFRAGVAATFPQARNDFGTFGYAGPCPPSGSGAHHYHFELLALSQPHLALMPGASVTQVIQAAAPYVVARAELVGTYQRPGR